ncbi:gasdermin-C [Megaptera novaeangliae]
MIYGLSIYETVSTFFSSQMITSGKPFRKALCQLIVLRDILFISDDDKWKTFPEDFKHLQKEVSREMEAMAQLPKDIQDAILHNILARLKDREALQDLMDMAGAGVPSFPVLSGTQHELQARSMEKRALLQQRELVKSILEPNFKYPWNIPFTLDPKLLTTLQEEGVAVTFSLLEERNLRVAPDSPEGTGGLEAEKPLLALYGSLSALQQLLRPEPSPGRSVQRGLATPPSAR